MNKNLAIMIFASAILFFLAEIVFLLRNENSTASSMSENSIANVDINSKGDINSEKINREILGNHNSETDCWISYNEKVYDITSWLGKHPGGGQAILPYCGTAEEFQAAFEKKHGTTKIALLMKVGIFIGDFELKGEIK